MAPLCYRRHRFPPEIIQHAIWLLRDKQDEKPYCLTGECSRDVEHYLSKRAPVASLCSGGAAAVDGELDASGWSTLSG
jgi:hypothetical protein